MRIYILISFLLFNPQFIFSAGSYFQQNVHYIINVTLDDKNHILTGNEKIIYRNNSPTELDRIYFHVYPNAYKDRSTILYKEIFNSGDDRMLSAQDKDFGYIDSLNFKADGNDCEWNCLKDSEDICLVKLDHKLKSGDSVKISTSFKVKIPASFLSRLGHDGQSYYLTQWYPKPAVYDRNGWNYFPYLDQGEYYSEFGQYDVYITLPKNYIIAATGKLIDNQEEEKWMLDSAQHKNLTSPTTEFKTLYFSQDSIHDFAWFADKNFIVKKDTVHLSNNNVKEIWLYYLNKDENYWKFAGEYTKEAMTFYSKLVGDYPYKSISLVDVGDAMGNAMEYPMIVTIGRYVDLFEFEITVEHEIGHSWFYGMLGSNERCHPWMDEGINNFYETRYVYTKYKNDSTLQTERTHSAFQTAMSINHRLRQYISYLSTARINYDQPPDQCSQLFSINNYHADAYYKTALSFDFLKEYLGDSLFDSCMNSYFDDWKFKHPQPEDIQEVFEKRSGKNLSWLFGDLLNSDKKLNYRIKDIICLSFKDSGQYTIVNKGEINSPLEIDYYSDLNISKKVWLEPFTGDSTIKFRKSGLNKLQIDAYGKMPELYTNDNTVRLNGLLKRTEPLKIEFLTANENKNLSQIFYIPAIGYNEYNKLMAGLIIHNYNFIEKKTEYAIMPLYAFGTKNIEGGGHVAYHIYPRNKIYRITLFQGISKYAFYSDVYAYPTNVNGVNNIYSNTLYFFKSDSKIIFSFTNNNRQKQVVKELTLRNVYIDRGIPYGIEYKQTDKKVNYIQAVFMNANLNPLDYNHQKAGITYGDSFLYAYIETKTFFVYNKKDKGFTVRTFAGYTKIPSRTTLGIGYKMNISGRDGLHDYLFDNVFIGRSETENIFSQQFADDYAGFKTPGSYFMDANKWMIGINASTTLPGILPFRLFGNVGTFDNAGIAGQFSKISWEMGIELPIIKDVFIIYYPFAYSRDIQYAVDRQGLNKGDLLRFQLNVNYFHPLNLLKNIYNH
jgi:hypothetical protein